jgi:mono/diheme cytochrome c family protein
MKRFLECAGGLVLALAAISVPSVKTGAQTRAEQSGRQHTAISNLEGPAIQMLIRDQQPQQDLRKLVTSSRTAGEHPNLAEYYQSEAQRLSAESKRYERFARAAGDTKPLSDPNHYGVSRSARFDYLAAKGTLRRAQDDNLLAALNEQARQKEGCFACHSFHGRGGTIAPDLALEGTRGRTNTWLMAHFKDPQAAAPNSVMPNFDRLTARQLGTLSAFLQYQK